MIMCRAMKRNRYGRRGSDQAGNMSAAGLLLLLVHALSAGGVSGQKANINLVPGEVLIGEHARMELELEVPSGSLVFWPALKENFTEEIEIIRFGTPDTIRSENEVYHLRQVHTITAWKEGFLAVPPIGFTVIMQGDTARIETPAALLEVHSIGLDPEGDLKDIRGILRLPVGLRDLWIYVVGLVAVGLLVWWLKRYFRKPEKPMKAPVKRGKPVIPAHIAALSSLEGLKEKKLWQTGRVKRYHSELSRIMRIYLRDRFALDALEMTTTEIMTALPGSVEDDSLREKLRHILEQADLVKFARFQPLDADQETALQAAFHFVERTKISVKNGD